MIQGRDEIDAFHRAPHAVIVMPTDDLIFVRVGLLRDAIIHDQHAIGALHLAHIGFDHLPKLRATFHRACQKALHAIMADRAIQQLRRPVPVVKPNELIR